LSKERVDHVLELVLCQHGPQKGQTEADDADKACVEWIDAREEETGDYWQQETTRSRPRPTTAN